MDDQEIQAFTLRLPRKLVKQIDERGKISRRKRNAQIQVMLEKFIDQTVMEDLKVLRTNEDLTSL